MVSPNRFVKVNITTGAQFPSRAGFGVLNVLTDQQGVLGLAERSRGYTSALAVAADWGDNSEPAAVAAAYFGQNPTPDEMKVTVRFEAPQSAELLGASVADNAANLASLVAISNGGLGITINGVDEVLSGIDLSGQTTMAGVAAVVETALALESTGATVDYENSNFVVRSGTTGATSTISNADSPVSGDDLADALGLVAGKGTPVQGVDAETVTASLNAAVNADSNFFGILFTKEVRDSRVVTGSSAITEAATWAKANNRVFFNTSNNLDCLNSAIDTDIGSVLRDTANDNVITTFSSKPDQYPSAEIAGVAFAVDFATSNSTIALKFQTLAPPENITDAQLDALESKNVNVAVNVFGVNIYTDGRVSSGKFFDEIHGLAWLANAIQTEVFGFLATNRVPGTDAGVASVEQRLINVLEEAVNNGLSAPGTISTGEFLPRGYKTVTTPIADRNSSDREARHYAGLSWVMKGAGALGSLVISGTFER